MPAFETISAGNGGYVNLAQVEKQAEWRGEIGLTPCAAFVTLEMEDDFK
jgi:hypothetical protein